MSPQIALWVLAGLVGWVALLLLGWVTLCEVVRRVGRRRAARRCLRCAPTLVAPAAESEPCRR